jgi:hypothetical protein
VQRNVGVNRIGIERLAKHQHRFFVLVAGEIRELDVGGDFNVARHFLPRELERIRGGPHVFAAATDGVGVLHRVERRRSGVQHGANIRMIVKDSDRGLGERERNDQRQH